MTIVYYGRTVNTLTRTLFSFVEAAMSITHYSIQFNSIPFNGA